LLDSSASAPTARVWRVGALCRAIADALDARFNPITVEGEIGGFSRAASGHCYLTLKDESGQLRCAMFRRAAIGLDFSPKDGDKVEVRGRLSVYEARGELQLVVDSMRKAGQGTLLEEFFKLKLRLEQEGLFDSVRKRPVPVMPRTIGLVTSLGAAALHDVVTALQRRVPHISVVLAPASVQGAGAPAEITRALEALYALSPCPDVILLVRGGGAMEDLWAFNDEGLARTIARSPVQLISGVGHETDFTIADFVADLRAPTPTAAAELASQSTQFWRDQTDQWAIRLSDVVITHLDRQAQRVDTAASRLGRPSALVQQQRMRLASVQQRLGHGLRMALQLEQGRWERVRGKLTPAAIRCHSVAQRRTDVSGIQLNMLDPTLVLQRGYAWLATADGTTLTRAAQAHEGLQLVATLADGTVGLVVHGQQQD
jgi:exodeoxyribonuclease VII large subunit